MTFRFATQSTSENSTLLLATPTRLSHDSSGMALPPNLYETPYQYSDFHLVDALYRRSANPINTCGQDVGTSNHMEFICPRHRLFPLFPSPFNYWSFPHSYDLGRIFDTDVITHLLIY